MVLRKQMSAWVYAAVAGVVMSPGAALAQAAPVAATTQVAATQAVAVPSVGTRVHGTVVDPDGELIPGAKVTLTPIKGNAAKQTVSGSDGMYSLPVPPGTYTLVVSMPGFATYSALNVKVMPGVAGQTFDVKMQVGTDVTINVDDTAAQLSVDPDSNASATVLSGSALDALSDDPDDLQNELEALAGPAAGPNGAQFYIDGFTGGQLPPKQSIREIRINQNPFSAQYDKPGFGRVEIFTKPGSDQFHGSFQFNANDSALNTGSPIVQAGVPQPAYHTILLNGQVSGPINKGSSFTFGGQFRNIQNNAIIAPESFAQQVGAATGTLCDPGAGAACTQTSTFPNFVAAISAPQTRYDISPRVDVALGANNTLTGRFRVEHATLNNQGIGGLALAANAYTATQGEQNVQISDNQTISQKIINEVHFEWERDTTGDVPLNTTPQLVVEGGFVAGGDPTGLTNDTQNHFEYQNYTSIALKKNFIRFGGRVRQTFETNTTNAGGNGDFLFLSSTATSALQNYVNGTPSQFSVTTYNQPTTHAMSIDAGLYAEDDWKPKPNVTLSYGLRYETQNFIGDKADFAPRLALAYGVGKKKSGGPAVVLRAGFGLFYDRLALGNQLNTVQENGLNQIPSTVTNPVLGANCSATIAAQQSGCGASAVAGHVQTQEVQTKGNFARNYHSPYQEQTNLGADLQPFKYATVSFNYQHVVGVHQLLNANLNAAADVTNPNAPIQDTYLTEGYYRQNQLITNFNYRGSAKWSLSTFYVVNFNTHSDTAGVASQPTDPYNLSADYGRASFDIRNLIFLFGSFNFPHLITVSPLLAARSGQPVNITTGEDNFGYLTNNTRPEFAPAGTPVILPGQPGANTFPGCGTFVNPGRSNGVGYTQIPTNYCTGPAAFTSNMRISKTIGFGNKQGQAGLQQGGGPGGPPPPGGHGPGGHGGGPHGGGPGGFFGGASSGKKYNLVLAVQFQNVFNVADRATPNGTLSSPTFGQLTALAGQLFTTNDAVRRVQLSASFNF